MPSSARRAVRRLSFDSRLNAGRPALRMFWNWLRCIFFTFPLRVAMKMKRSACGSEMATTAVTVSSFGLMASIQVLDGRAARLARRVLATSNTRLR